MVQMVRCILRLDISYIHSRTGVLHGSRVATHTVHVQVATLTSSQVGTHAAEHWAGAALVGALYLRGGVWTYVCDIYAR